MPAINFSRFSAEVLDLYAPPLRAAATWRQIRQILVEVGQVPRVRKTSDLTAATVGEWIRAHPGRSPARTRSLLSALRSCINYGVANGYIAKSPFAWRGIEDWIRADVVVAARRRPRQHCTGEEVAKLLELLDLEAEGRDWHRERLRALVYLFAYTGVRKGEGLHLQRSDVNIRRRTLTISPKVDWRVKTPKSAATLPLADPLAEVLEAWLPRARCEWVFPGTERKGPWIHGSPGYRPLDAIKKAGRRAGILNLTFLSFRKTLATLAKGWGLGQLELIALLRHTGPDMLRYYQEDSIEELRKATAKINYQVPHAPERYFASIESVPA